MANAGNSLVAPTSSTHPGGTASGSRVSNQAGMPRKRRRSNTRKSPKKKKQQSGDDVWCEIKGILGEREVNGQVQYLVDWEDHSTTGEAYPQEWVGALLQDCAKIFADQTIENQSRLVEAIDCAVGRDEATANNRPSRTGQASQLERVKSTKQRRRQPRASTSLLPPPLISSIE